MRAPLLTLQRPETKPSCIKILVAILMATFGKSMELWARPTPPVQQWQGLPLQLFLPGLALCSNTGTFACSAVQRNVEKAVQIDWQRAVRSCRSAGPKTRSITAREVSKVRLAAAAK